jgi:phospholipid-translocating ATPase
VIAVVVYTGPHTKLSQFKTPPVPKSSQTEKIVNRITIVVFIVQVVIAVSLGITGIRLNLDQNSHWYLQLADDPLQLQIVVFVLRFILLISMLIPISIKVTLDTVQFLSSKFIAWDLYFSEGGRSAARVRDTTISEDLGQVEYVLTDKTGTLTQNVMQLSCCSIGGNVYGDHSRYSISRGQGAVLHSQPDILAILPDAPVAADFPMPNTLEALVPSPSLLFTALAVCNTVSPKQQCDLQGQQFGFSGASPDEEAFVETCAHLGFILAGRTQTTVDLDLRGNRRGGKSTVVRHRYTILRVFEFSSDRKMMSVLLRLPSGLIVLISKGADEVMLPLCSTTCSVDHLRRQQEICDDFASSGLRTLVVGCRGVSEEEYAQWLSHTFHPAELQTHEREKALAKAYARLEVGLHLIGSTGLVDALQENVSETIHALQDGGVKVWMLTGDKLSTAMQIAVSAGLARDLTVFHKIDSVDPTDHDCAIDNLSRRVNDIEYESVAINRIESTTQEPRRMRSAGGANAAVVIAGSTFASMSAETKLQLVSVCIQFACVVCCRLSPRQKAEIVHLVRTAALPKPSTAMRLLGMQPLHRTTLAVGDGGNDVPMIQAAHCGVAVLGKEGTQAALASDFTISDFQSLQRLLLVHGRYSYIRLSYIAQFSFYKSWVFCIVQIVYAFYSDFSGASL